MIELKAYCIVCEMNVTGKLLEIIKLDSGKHLFKGECSICFWEIKRIMPSVLPTNLKQELIKGLDNGSEI